MSKNSSTILITGATGLLGSEVMKQLSSVTPAVKIKAAIHSVENLKRVKENDAAARVEPVLFDYEKPETLREALGSVDKLFLLTPETPKASELASNAVSEAKKAGIRHIVKQSVQAADNTAAAIVSTIRLHRQAEEIIEESGIPYTFLRPGEFMQNFIRWYSETIKEQGAFYLPAAGDTKVGFVDVRDIAAVAVKALTEEEDENGKHKNKAYTITGPEELSYYQAAEILSNAIGRKIDYVNISEEEARRAMKDMGISDWLINGVIEVIELYRSGIPQLSSAVEEVTGKKPISFSQFAKDYAHVFR